MDKREAILRDLLRGTEHEKKMFRKKREALLCAFDKYKTNVQYGIEVENADQHAAIIAWYRSILDLENSAIAETAINNVPARIKYYL